MGDIDFERSAIHPVDSAAGGWNFGLLSPKTDSSRRRIPFALGLGELLTAASINTHKRTVAGRVGRTRYGLHHGSRHQAGRQQLGSCLPQRRKARRLTYIPFHRLRHTAASFFKEHGLTDEEIRILLGHSSSRTTEEFYLHATPDSEARLVRALDQIYSPVAVSVAVKNGNQKPN